MNIIDIINKKKYKEALTQDEIKFFVDGYTKGEIPDYQMSALLMAILLNGMNYDETYFLTDAMEHSGEVLDLSAIDGVTVDKHSTGGVGDKTTLTLAPLVASLGVPVAKMSGRGLGFTGGTIDKLECFGDINLSLTDEDFIKNVNEIGIAVSGQTKDLAPADKKIYALRDITGCVDSIPLIASSIMSKKLALGTDAIVLDVKCGNGAFMTDISDARLLAETMISIGRKAGKKMAAIISDMNEPLGNMVGNSLEVYEAIEALNGRGPADFMEVVYKLGYLMLKLSGKTSSENEAISMMQENIGNGKAKEKLVELIKKQGGDYTPVLDTNFLPRASIIRECPIDHDCYIKGINAGKIGRAEMLIGGGREKKDDKIDLSVGFCFPKKTGDRLKKNDIYCTIFGNSEEKVYEANQNILDAFQFSDDPVGKQDKILEVIE